MGWRATIEIGGKDGGRGGGGESKEGKEDE